MSKLDLTRRQFMGVFGATAAIAGLAACGGAQEPAAEGGEEGAADAALAGSISCSGATSFQPLVEKAADAFMEANGDVSIAISAGGSGQGLSQVAEGSVQIGRSDVFAEEKLEADQLENLVDNQVCIVGMGPIVNADVTVDDIKLEDLKKIFTGEITNWSEVGGADSPITVINRASGSGTRATFEEVVLAGTKVPDSFKPQEQDSSGTAAKMVASTPGAISYVAFSYFDSSFKALKVDGVEPDAQNVEDNSWKIWSYEHMYTAASPDEATKAFLEYMMGEEVQGGLVEQQGYIPMSGMKVEKDASGKVSNK